MKLTLSTFVFSVALARISHACRLCARFAGAVSFFQRLV